jgi:hypothetical protein
LQDNGYRKGQEHQIIKNVREPAGFASEMNPRISHESKTATRPGFMPPYQKVMAIADNANAANG